MPARTSAGLLLYRRRDGHLEVLVGHMGGPFWSRKDDGSWTIPKGEYDAASEEPLAAARREFEEELGSPAPSTGILELGSVRQAGGKVVTVFAAEGDLDPSQAKSSSFSMEWPKGSGRMQEFPELDRVDWLDPGTARRKLLAAQVTFLDRLEQLLG